MLTWMVKEELGAARSGTPKLAEVTIVHMVGLHRGGLDAYHALSNANSALEGTLYAAINAAEVATGAADILCGFGDPYDHKA